METIFLPLKTGVQLYTAWVLSQHKTIKLMWRKRMLKPESSFWVPLATVLVTKIQMDIVCLGDDLRKHW